MIINVSVKTRANCAKIEQLSNTIFKIWVTEPPEKGKANKKVIELVAKHLKIPKSSIFIKAGTKSSDKLIEIKKPV